MTISLFPHPSPQTHFLTVFTGMLMTRSPFLLPMSLMARENLFSISDPLLFPKYVRSTTRTCGRKSLRSPLMIDLPSIRMSISWDFLGIVFTPKYLRFPFSKIAYPIFRVPGSIARILSLFFLFIFHLLDLATFCDEASS